MKTRNEVYTSLRVVSMSYKETAIILQHCIPAVVGVKYKQAGDRDYKVAYQRTWYTNALFVLLLVLGLPPYTTLGSCTLV